jgi:hypothetical protein
MAMFQNCRGVPGLGNVRTELGKQMDATHDRFDRDDAGMPLSVWS